MLQLNEKSTKYVNDRHTGPHYVLSVEVRAGSKTLRAEHRVSMYDASPQLFERVWRQLEDQMVAIISKEVLRPMLRG